MTLTKPVEVEDRIDQSANCHLLSAPINKRLNTVKKAAPSAAIVSTTSLPALIALSVAIPVVLIGLEVLDRRRPGRRITQNLPESGDPLQQLREQATTFNDILAQLRQGSALIAPPSRNLDWLPLLSPRLTRDSDIRRDIEQFLRKGIDG